MIAHWWASTSSSASASRIVTAHSSAAARTSFSLIPAVSAFGPFVVLLGQFGADQP
jgi:hypothetical protein